METIILAKAKEITDVKVQELKLHSMRVKHQTDIVMRQSMRELERRDEERRKKLLGNSDDDVRDPLESVVVAIRSEHDQLMSYMKNFSFVVSSCQPQQHLNKSTVDKLYELMKQIAIKMSQDLKNAQNGQTVELEMVQHCTEQGKKVLMLLMLHVDEAREKAAEEEKQRIKDKEEEEAARQIQKRKEEERRLVQKREAEELERRQREEREEKDKRMRAEESMKQKLREAASNQPAPLPPSSTAPTSEGPKERVRDVSTPRNRKAAADINLEMYSSLQTLRTLVENQCSSLVNDSKWSKYRFSLQKAVMGSLNTLTGAQLQSKLDYLIRLIRGEPVEVARARVTTKDHPAAAMFTYNYLAKKIVYKSESLASQRDLLFSLANLAVGIWCHNKDIGYLILSYLYLSCPYAALVRPTRGDKSEDEYLRSLGYNIEDGNVEPESKFLDRMAGYISLYAAIIVSHPPASAPSHPHGLECAWKWFSVVINSDPLPEITATVVYYFLDICGNRMMQTYGRQFWKLMQFLNDSFLPKIKSCGGDGGPVTRLEIFLAQSLRTGRIKEPEGLIQRDVWSVR